jgi:hypothetical protein
LFHRGFEQTLRRIFHPTIFPDVCRRHVGIAIQFRAFKPLLLPFSAGSDARLDFLRFLPQSVISQFLIIDTRHLDKDIDTVQERPANPFLVSGDCTRGTGALTGRRNNRRDIREEKNCYIKRFITLPSGRWPQGKQDNKT